MRRVTVGGIGLPRRVGVVTEELKAVGFSTVGTPITWSRRAPVEAIQRTLRARLVHLAARYEMASLTLWTIASAPSLVDA